MENQIELLVNLQTIDLQLRERTDAIEVLRREMADLEGAVAEQRQALEAVRAERADIESRRRDIEGTLTDEEGKTMAWCCTEGTRAFIGDAPVIESLGAELEAITGQEVYVELRRRITDQ